MFNILDLKQLIFHYLSQSQDWERVVILLFFFVALPSLGFPLVFLVALSAFLLSGIQGILVAVSGYVMASFFYFELSNKFSNIPLIRKILNYFLSKLKLSQKIFSFSTMVFLSTICPFLPLVLYAGSTHQKRANFYSGFFLGILPAFVTAYSAGLMSKSLLEFDLSFNKQKLLFSIVVIVGGVGLQMFIKYLARSREI